MNEKSGIIKNVTLDGCTFKISDDAMNLDKVLNTVNPGLTAIEFIERLTFLIEKKYINKNDKICIYVDGENICYIENIVMPIMEPKEKVKMKGAQILFSNDFEFDLRDKYSYNKDE
jgi:hypothetical protein